MFDNSSEIKFSWIYGIYIYISLCWCNIWFARDSSHALVHSAIAMHVSLRTIVQGCHSYSKRITTQCERAITRTCTFIFKFIQFASKHRSHDKQYSFHIKGDKFLNPWCLSIILINHNQRKHIQEKIWIFKYWCYIYICRSNLKYIFVTLNSQLTEFRLVWYRRHSRDWVSVYLLNWSTWQLLWNGMSPTC